MKPTLCFLSLCLVVQILPTRGDVITLSESNVVNGTILRTNTTDILVLTEYSTVSCAKSNIVSVTFEPASFSLSPNGRLPDFRTTLRLLAVQSWASELKQIPATVIDNGPMKNVPYLSFRCGDDYEVNIYGDLDHPAAIEAGTYRKLKADPLAKSHCENFILSLLRDSADKDIVKGLSWEQDLKTRDGLTFEVTPPTAPDAYEGWWLSVYSETELAHSCASEKELKEITASPFRKDEHDAPWTADELSLARPSKSEIITVTTSSGFVITNAEVVRVNQGVSLVWRSGGAGGIAKLADLSPELQEKFGYDPIKARAAEEAEKARLAREREVAQAAAEQAHTDANNPPVQTAANYVPTSSPYGGTGSRSYAGSGTSTPSHYSGGPVFVRGYVRSNGTYVQPYTRSAPHRR